LGANPLAIQALPARWSEILLNLIVLSPKSNPAADPSHTEKERPGRNIHVPSQACSWYNPFIVPATPDAFPRATNIKAEQKKHK
jgi:hypothetical protein